MNCANTTKSTDNSKLMNLAGTFYTTVYELETGGKDFSKKVKATGTGGDKELVFFT